MSTTTAPPETGPETGWSPDAPRDDTILRRFVLAHVDSLVALASVHGGRVERDERFVAVDHDRPTELLNATTLVRPLHGAGLEAALEDIERFHAGPGDEDVLLWSPWPIPDLRSRGWSLVGHPPLLWRPASAVTPGRARLDEHDRDELRVDRVEDRAGMDQWCATIIDAFPFEEMQAARPGILLDERALDRDDFAFQLGLVAGRPVGASSYVAADDLTILFLAAVPPDARGRGHYQSLVAHRLAARPDLPAAAIVSDLSRPVLTDRFGFLPVTRFTLWSRPRP